MSIRKEVLERYQIWCDDCDRPISPPFLGEKAAKASDTMYYKSHQRGDNLHQCWQCEHKNRKAANGGNADGT